CDLRIVEGENGDHLQKGDHPQSAVIAEILRQPYGFQLSRRDNEQCTISINNNPIAKLPTGSTIELQDGDLLGFRQNGKEARYSLHVIEDRSLRPAAKSADNQGLRFPEVDTVGHIHPLTATRFLKGLATSLWLEIPRRFKMLSLSLMMTLLFGG